VHRFAVPHTAEFANLAEPGIRVDSAVEAGSVVGLHYDPLLAKVIAWAPTRTEAARSLAGALVRSQLHGVATNRDLLVRVLRDPEFLAGGTDTAYLDRHPEVFRPLLDTVDGQRLACLAAALAGSVDPSAPWRALPTGWRNLPSAPQTVAFTAPWGPVEVAYRLDRTGALEQWSIDGEPGPPVVLIRRDSATVVLEAIVQQTFRVHRVGGTSFVDGPDGSLTLIEVPRFAPPAPAVTPGSLVAPMPGSIGRVETAAGAVVAAGELLLTIEAMKMEHAVLAPGPGTVTELLVAPGDQVEPGTPLVVVTPLVAQKGTPHV
jgi:propionyl-CoA carboxylase alpha chain